MKKIITLVLALAMLLGVLAAAAVSAGDFPFTDVKETRWSRKSIEYAYEMKYMDGVGGGKFDPAGTMTRAMAVTVLYRKEGSPAVDFKADFSDVKAGKYYSNAVIWAKNNNIVNGVSEGKFDPNGKITREQLAAILYRYAEFAELDRTADGDLSRFPDAGEAHKYAKDALAWAASAGLIGGVKSGDVDLLDPAGYATREQFAAIIERFDAYAETAGTPLTEADFYVSPRGKDTNDGSFAHPFRTLGRAILAVREVEKTPEKASVTVALRAGTYYLSDFDLEPEDSGAAECPVVYKAYGDGDVTVTNGFTLTASDFGAISEGDKAMFKEAAAGSVKCADVAARIPFGASPVTLKVYDGDGELDLARYPNRFSNGDDNLFDQGADASGASTMKVKNPVAARRLKNYKTTDGMLLYGNISYEEYMETVSVGSYDAATSTLTLADPTEMRSYPWFGGFRYVLDEEGRVDEDHTRVNIRFAVLNMAEELDAAGEYYTDFGSGTLYAYAPEEDLLVLAENAGSGAAEYVTFDGVNFNEETFERDYDIPVKYVDKDGGDGFRILNVSDPQLYNEDVDGSGGRILRETVGALMESERPDLITATGDLAWGGHIIGLEYFCGLMTETGVPWAPILGNHDHQEWNRFVHDVNETLENAGGCLYDKGDPRLGDGNYVVILRQNGVPIHALIMMDTGGKVAWINDEGGIETDQGEFSEKQIEWYGKVCEMLNDMGVPESTVICHIPCYTYREAWAAALLPEVDPKSVPAGDGMQVGCWAEGYEDSFGVAHTNISSSAVDNGFFDKVLEYGNTKTLLCGHNHENCFSVGYRGVRFVYSLKTGCGFSWERDMSGGTVIEIDANGHATLRHHYVSVE